MHAYPIPTSSQSIKEMAERAHSIEFSGWNQLLTVLSAKLQRLCYELVKQLLQWLNRFLWLGDGEMEGINIFHNKNYTLAYR